MEPALALGKRGRRREEREERGERREGGIEEWVNKCVGVGGERVREKREGERGREGRQWDQDIEQRIEEEKSSIMISVQVLTDSLFPLSS